MEIPPVRERSPPDRLRLDFRSPALLEAAGVEFRSGTSHMREEDHSKRAAKASGNTVTFATFFKKEAQTQSPKSRSLTLPLLRTKQDVWVAGGAATKNGERQGASKKNR